MEAPHHTNASSLSGPSPCRRRISQSRTVEPPRRPLALAGPPSSPKICAGPFFCQLVPFLLFPTTPWSSDNDPPFSTSSTVWPFRHTRCSWGCYQAGKRLSCALSNTTSDASGLRRQSLFAGAQVGEITCGGERTSFWFWSGCGLRCRRATCTPTRTSRAPRLSLVCVPDPSLSVGQPLACPASRNVRPSALSRPRC